MAALTTYTTYAEIRAALGVSDDEIEDDTLALDLYSSALTADLKDVASGIPTQFETIANMTEDARTETQQDFFEATRLFATYSVAKQLASGLPLFSPKDMTDGKASFSRFADSPYRETIKRINEQFDRMRNRLANLYAEVQSSSTTPVTFNFFTAVSPATDPVTGL